MEFELQQLFIAEEPVLTLSGSSNGMLLLRLRVSFSRLNMCLHEARGEMIQEHLTHSSSVWMEPSVGHFCPLPLDVAGEKPRFLF